MTDKGHGWMNFKVGDVVSRDGTDRQRILEINGGGDLIHVECVKEPLGAPNEDGGRDKPWCAIGEREWNVAWRYEYVEELAVW